MFATGLRSIFCYSAALTSTRPWFIVTWKANHVRLRILAHRGGWIWGGGGGCHRSPGSKSDTDSELHRLYSLFLSINYGDICVTEDLSLMIWIGVPHQDPLSAHHGVKMQQHRRGGGGMAGELPSPGHGLASDVPLRIGLKLFVLKILSVQIYVGPS